MQVEIRNHWRQDLTAAADAVSPPIVLPRRFGTASVKVLPGVGGTAEIEYTMDDPNAALADPSSVAWEVWDPGTVSADTTRALISVVAALRLRAFLQPARAQVVVSFDF